MNSYNKALNVEFFKLKRTITYLIIVVTPLLFPVLMTLTLYFKSENFNAIGIEAWNVIKETILTSWSILLMPMMIVLLASSTGNMEHNSRSWKHLFAMSISKDSIYFAKFTMLLILTGISTLILWIGTMGCGAVINLIKPETNLIETMPALEILGKSIIIYLGSIVITGIQSWLSLCVAKSNLPVFVGISGIIAGVFISNYPAIAPYYPWLVPGILLSSANGNTHLTLLNLAYFVILTVTVYLAGRYTFVKMERHA